MSQVALIKSALNTPVASMMPPADLATQLTDILSYLHQYCGQTHAEGDLYFQANELKKEIEGEFRHLRVGEIKIAFQNGVKNKYGEYYGLNMRTYTAWLNAYRIDPDRIDAKKQVPALQEGRKELTDDDYRKMLDICYDKWMKTGEIWDYGNSLYTWLITKKYIKLTSDQWYTWLRKAKTVQEQQLLKEKQNRKDRLDKLGVQQIDVKLAEMPITSEHEAKRMILEEFFIKLRDNDN